MFAMKVLAVAFISMLLLSVLAVTQFAETASAETIIVPDDYTTIQEAINAATTGDTILVGNGTYYENLILNKTVTLVGENPQTTIISGNTSVTLNITANNVTVTGFTITGASTAGIEVTSNYTSIIGNTMTNNSWGLYVHENYNNITQNNMANNSNCGIGLKNAFFTRITGNAISGSKGAGIDIRYSNNNILRGNDINVPSSLFVILLVGSPHNIIAGNNLMGGTNDLIIQCGDDSDYNEISENNITGTGGYAISGIALFTASNCNISRNNVTNCWEGIGLLNPMGPSMNNTISGNYITANQRGIRLIEALNNTISENNITANTVYGIGSDNPNVQGSNNNTIYHNNFVDNAQQANSAGGNNTWDNDYPSGGNYWSDYDGIDADGDNIGDTPYVIDVNNTDRYPLMFPFGTSRAPIATTAYVSVEPNPVGVGQTVNVSMLIEPPPPSPTERFSGLKVYFTRPDNTTEYMGPLFSNPNGSVSIYYTPSQVGTYAVQLNYPGESFVDGTIVYESATSAITILNVTAEPQPNPNPSPTPESTPTPSPSPTPSPIFTPSPTSTPSPSPSPTPTPTPQPTHTPTPSSTPSPEPEPFPTTIAVAVIASITVIGIGFLFYFKKYKK